MCKIGPIAEPPSVTNDVITLHIKGTTDTLVLKTKSLSEIYEEYRYSSEPTSYTKAAMSHECLMQ